MMKPPADAAREWYEKNAGRLYVVTPGKWAERAAIEAWTEARREMGAACVDAAQQVDGEFDNYIHGLACADIIERIRALMGEK